VNDIAAELLPRLIELGYLPEGGYFGTQHYCAAVSVRDVCEATTLGMSLGNGEWGKLGFDVFPQSRFHHVVFCDAHVSL
jgi:hypothetical protein